MRLPHGRQRCARISPYLSPRVCVDSSPALVLATTEGAEADRLALAMTEGAMAGRYWLVKCEPSECSLDELSTRPKRTGYWRGVRNYQARNMIRDDMGKGDWASFYHSNCDEPGIAGVVQISRAGYPDPSQFDAASRYFDPKAEPAAPRWFSFDVKWKKRFKTFVNLSALKDNTKLAAMRVVQKGQRLSIQPVTAGEWREVCRMGGIEPPA